MHEWAEDGRLTKDITYNYDAPVSEYLVIYHGDGYTEMNRRNGELSGSWISWFQMERKMKKESIKMVKKVEYGMGGIGMVKKDIVVNM